MNLHLFIYYFSEEHKSVNKSSSQFIIFNRVCKILKIFKLTQTVCDKSLLALVVLQFFAICIRSMTLFIVTVIVIRLFIAIEK